MKRNGRDERIDGGLGLRAQRSQLQRVRHQRPSRIVETFKMSGIDPGCVGGVISIFGQPPENFRWRSRSSIGIRVHLGEPGVARPKRDRDASADFIRFGDEVAEKRCFLHILDKSDALVHHPFGKHEQLWIADVQDCFHPLFCGRCVIGSMRSSHRHISLTQRCESKVDFEVFLGRGLQGQASGKPGSQRIQSLFILRADQSSRRISKASC